MNSNKAHRLPPFYGTHDNLYGPGTWPICLRVTTRGNPFFTGRLHYTKSKYRRTERHTNDGISRHSRGTTPVRKDYLFVVDPSTTKSENDKFFFFFLAHPLLRRFRSSTVTSPSRASTPRPVGWETVSHLLSKNENRLVRTLRRTVNPIKTIDSEGHGVTIVKPSTLWKRTLNTETKHWRPSQPGQQRRTGSGGPGGPVVPGSRSQSKTETSVVVSGA